MDNKNVKIIVSVLAFLFLALFVWYAVDSCGSTPAPAPAADPNPVIDPLPTDPLPDEFETQPEIFDDEDLSPEIFDDDVIE